MVDENIIRRVRMMIVFGLSLSEVADACDDLTTTQVFLAYHAAKIACD